MSEGAGAGEIPVLAPELVTGAGGDFPEDAYADAGAFEARAGYWYRPRGELIAWSLGHYFPAARSFLDSGCGAGPVLESIRASNAAIELAGVDASVAALEIARRRVRGLEVVQGGAHALPYRERFDAVGCFDVLEHLDDDLGALVELAATARPGGGVLLSVPQHPWLWSEVDEAGGHKRRYRRGELLALLGRAGLEPLRVSSYVFVLLPLLAASRVGLMGRGSDETGDPGPMASQVLERVLRTEVAAYRRGVSYPAGGSLFVVARKGRDGEK